jgi:hypothetical protein
MLTEMQQSQIVPKPSHDKVADLVWIASGLNDLSGIWVREPRLASSEKHSGMHRSQQRTPPGSEYPADFREEMVQVLDVLEHECAHDAIKEAVLEWKTILDVVNNEPDGVGTRLAARPSEHSFGKVNSRSDRTGAREPQSVPSGSAAQVKDGKTPHRTQLLMNDRFLESRKRVRVIIVNARPAIVAAANCPRFR